MNRIITIGCEFGSGGRGNRPPALGRITVRLLRPGDYHGSRQPHSTVREIYPADQRTQTLHLLSYSHWAQLLSGDRSDDSKQCFDFCRAASAAGRAFKEVGLHHRGPVRGLHSAGHESLPNFCICRLGEQAEALHGAADGERELHCEGNETAH